MTETNSFIMLLGKSASDAELLHLFQKENISMFPYDNDGFPLHSADIELKSKGVGFSFDIHRPFLPYLDKNTYLEEFVFSSIFLYADCKDEYKQFNGNIPQGLSFALLRADLVELFGRPAFTRKRRGGKSVAIDRWDMKTHSIFVEYWKTSSKISLITFTPKVSQPRLGNIEVS